MSKEQYDYAIERMKESVEKCGFGTINTKNGRLLMFKRTALQKILDENPDKPQILLFLQEEVSN